MKSVAQQWKEEGIEQGVLLGKQQGIEQGIERVAAKMLADGDSIENIARVTGLSTAKIQTIKSLLH